MSLPLAVALAYVVTTGVGVAMMLTGLRKGLLVHRATRRCPSCGRLVRSGHGCRCASPR